MPHNTGAGLFPLGFLSWLKDVKVCCQGWKLGRRADKRKWKEAGCMCNFRNAAMTSNSQSFFLALPKDSQRQHRRQESGPCRAGYQCWGPYVYVGGFHDFMMWIPLGKRILCVESIFLPSVPLPFSERTFHEHSLPRTLPFIHVQKPQFSACNWVFSHSFWVVPI